MFPSYRKHVASSLRILLLDRKSRHFRLKNSSWQPDMPYTGNTSIPVWKCHYSAGSDVIPEIRLCQLENITVSSERCHADNRHFRFENLSCQSEMRYIRNMLLPVWKSQLSNGIVVDRCRILGIRYFPFENITLRPEMMPISSQPEEWSYRKYVASGLKTRIFRPEVTSHRKHVISVRFFFSFVCQDQVLEWQNY